MTVRITVDRDKCQGYGQCEFEAPDLFHLDDTGTSVPAADVDESLRADASARRTCARCRRSRSSRPA